MTAERREATAPDPAGGAGLALEASQPRRIMSAVVAEDLDGDRTGQLDVAGAKDPAHAAHSQGAEDLAVAKPNPWG
jgi:hypothetical protein